MCWGLAGLLRFPDHRGGVRLCELLWLCDRPCLCPHQPKDVFCQDLPLRPAAVPVFGHGDGAGHWQKSSKTAAPKLEFQNVEFWYEEQRPILQGVSFSVEPGEKVAIIGQNGSRKSTILNLLLRFYVPDAGQILADDTDIQEIPLEEYRSLFSVVSQEPYLFLGNILENVDLQGNADPEKLQAALQSSGVEGYLPRMPEKEQTQIGRNGARLSGGEKQKLAVARAL